MNYRHVYHAGNFADVAKHLLLVLCLDHLRKKDAPFFVLDAHAGTGYYNLQSVEAQKTKEYEAGIAKLIAAAPQSADVKLYLSKVQGDFEKQRYPGSPLIAARMLRDSDRLIANELHAEDVKILKKTLGPRKNAQVTQEDAYQSIRAHVPPPERRGLVLIDPPYEIENNEHDVLIKQMQEWKKRWPTGTYILWYPVKDSLPSAKLHEAAAALGLNRTWLCEYRDADLPPLPASDRGDRKRMRSTGLIVFNAPFQVPERAEAALGEIAGVLGGSVHARWLVTDTGNA
jgi:23S rRNA (adenine2030-N6)-methyltransferase